MRNDRGARSPLDERRVQTIRELASQISEQRNELGRLNRQVKHEIDKRLALYEAVQKLDLNEHAPICHVIICPEKDGCEERDGGYLGTYMDHDCNCGVDAVRWQMGHSRVPR